MFGHASGATIQGPRDFQEDLFLIRPIVDPEWDGVLLAVMDGHGGTDVARYAKEVLETEFNPGPPRRADIEIRHYIRKMADVLSTFESGSTLSLALIMRSAEGTVAHVAILGDSPVVIQNTCGGVAVSKVHNVRTNRQERERAVLSGAHYQNGKLWYGASWIEMSRALGNRDMSRVLRRVPDVYTIDNPALVVVCSDGFYQSGKSGHRATARMMMAVAEHRDADDLIAWRSRRGLTDNATVVRWSLTEPATL